MKTLKNIIEISTNVAFCLGVAGAICFYFFVYSKEEHKPMANDLYYGKEFTNAVNKAIDYNPLVPMVFNASGQITAVRCRVSLIRVALTSSPQTVDLSAAGFTTIMAAFTQGENNTTVVQNMPNTTTKITSGTSIILNTTVGNTGVIGLLAGLITPTNFTGMYVNILVIGQ